MTDPEITQADREVAATMSTTLAHAANVQLGNLDDSEGVIAIARHRMLGRAEGAAQERAEIVTWLRISISNCPLPHIAEILKDHTDAIERGEYKRSE